MLVARCSPLHPRIGCGYCGRGPRWDLATVIGLASAAKFCQACMPQRSMPAVLRGPARLTGGQLQELSERSPERP